jgi:hypothetical protein
MFVAHDVRTAVPYVTARLRLMELIASRALADVSRTAYSEGLASPVPERAGPARPAPVRLMRVRCLRPAHGEDRMTAGLRWEAVGVPGGPFPVLDADLTLAAAGPQASRLSLAGVYRLPPSDDPDPAMAGEVAEMTVRALLRSAAAYLSSADGRATSVPRTAGAP